MKKLLVLTIACVCVVSCAGVAHAAFVTASGYSATELYNTYDEEFEMSITTIGGLALDSGKLYFGQFTDIKSLDLSTNNVSVVGTVPSNAGNSLVARHDNVTYTSYGTGSASPYPYKMGYIDAGGGAYVNQLDMNGIYDVAVNSIGDCYIVANPDPDTSGSKIFKYDWATGGTAEIATIGGFSGGLAFDSADNLYYAEQTQGEILKFSATEVAAGGLGIDDADVVLSNLWAGYIGLNSDGDFFATGGYGTAARFSKYDLSTESKVCDIAIGDAGSSFGRFVANGDDIYLVHTNWNEYGSSVQHVVPEPSTLVLLGMAGVVSLIGFAVRRRNARLKQELQITSV